MSQGVLDGFEAETELIPPVKKCSKCSRELPLGMFHAKCTARDGKRSHCRDCERERARGRQRVIEGIADELLCTKCNQVKPQAEFQTARITSNSRGWCKDCTRQYDKQQAAKKKKRWQERIDAGEIRQCKSCQKSKPVRDFVTEANTCLACSCRKYNTVLKNKIRIASDKCIQRGLSFDLTLKEYSELAASPCTYCGGPLPEVGIGLDRIDNTKGYSRFNCIPCCTRCNVARGDFWSVAQMVRIGAQIRKERELLTDVTPVSWNGFRQTRTKPPNSETAERAPKKTWSPELFVQQFLTADPQPKSAVLITANEAGISKYAAHDLIIASVSAGLAFVWWPPSGPRVKHIATVPYDGRHGFCSSGPGDIGLHHDNVTACHN